ncbi:hypothetical protein GCM10022254_20630 [Actinomadura meridiana]|uniref:DUF8017 domain-containing protein n=1 Tax=Actinomadura meridiana TaxID=559626 RepID=A0ABP8BWX8_9ACTN
MTGDKGFGGIGDDSGRDNPYPLPGQDWETPQNDTPPPPTPGDPSSFIGGRSVRSRPSRIWLAFLGPFVAFMLVIATWAGYEFYQLSQDPDVEDEYSSAPPPDSPEPEPSSTVPPRVRGWKAVSSAKYGLTYDVSPSWRILPSGTLHGYEGVNGGNPVMMSSGAEFREGACKDGDDEYDRADTGFNQYVVGDVLKVANHAANKWATNGYSEEGAPAPVVTLSAPKTVRVGRARAVYIRADVVVKAGKKCSPPKAVVHTVAVPGVAPGLTTVFVLLADQGVPDALPNADMRKILASLRPNPTPTSNGA